MKRSLHRLLRVRRMLERLSLSELEKKHAELRRLEDLAEQNRRLALAVRDEALRHIVHGSSAAWLLDSLEADLQASRGLRLEQKAAEHLPEVDAARQALLDRRRDRLQAELLLASAASAEQSDQFRHEQRQIDDWFQSRLWRQKQ